MTFLVACFAHVTITIPFLKVGKRDTTRIKLEMLKNTDKIKPCSIDSIYFFLSYSKDIVMLKTFLFFPSKLKQLPHFIFNMFIDLKAKLGMTFVHVNIISAGKTYSLIK